MDYSSECSRKSTLTFLENGSGSQISYDENYDGNGTLICENDYNGTFTWQNTNATVYEINQNGQIVSVELTFSQNNTIFSTTSSETINGTTYTVSSTYIKI